MRYNNVWGNGTQLGYEQNYIGLSAGLGSLAVDPMFRQVETGDYRLLAGSFVIGKGHPTGVDMGALPFVSALSAPVGLTVDVDGEYRWLARWNQQQAQGYNFYWGNHPHLYEQRLDMGNAKAYIMRHLRGGVTYYAAVSAYDSAGNESQLSAEISFYVPPLAQGTYEENHPALSWSGNWTSVTDSHVSGGSYLRSTNLGDKFEMTFVGDTLVIYRNLAPNGGWAKLIIDGQVYGYLAFGFVEPRWQVPIILDRLGSGIHQLSVEVIEHPYLEPSLGSVMIDSFALPSPFAPTSVQRQALEQTNWYRSTAGLPLAIGVQAVHQGAQGHAEFVANNKDHPSVAGLGFHQETANLPGFIGKWSSDRARYFGYSGGLGEDGHFVGDPVGSVDGWMATIYHRNLIMCYGCIELGYGMVNDHRGRFDVLNMGSRTYPSPPKRLIVAYPASGQTNISTEWNGAETPDPLPNKPKPVGYPISIHIVQPPSTAITAANLDGSSPFGFTQQLQRSSQWLITTAELRDVAKQIVPTYLLEQNTDPADYLGPDNAFLVAHKPLKENSTYSVVFAGIDSQGKPSEKRWAFSTGGIVEAPSIQAHLWSEPAFPVNTQEINFFIRLTNQSQYTAQQIRMTVGTPENATFVPNSATTNQGQLQQDAQLVLTLDDLPASATVELHYRVTTNSQPSMPLVVGVPVEVVWHSGNSSYEQIAIVNANYLYLPLVPR